MSKLILESFDRIEVNKTKDLADTVIIWEQKREDSDLREAGRSKKSYIQKLMIRCKIRSLRIVRSR